MFPFGYPDRISRLEARWWAAFDDSRPTNPSTHRVRPSQHHPLANPHRLSRGKATGRSDIVQSCLKKCNGTPGPQAFSWASGFAAAAATRQDLLGPGTLLASPRVEFGRGDFPMSLALLHIPAAVAPACIGGSGRPLGARKCWTASAACCCCCLSLLMIRSRRARLNCRSTTSKQGTPPDGGGSQEAAGQCTSAVSGTNPCGATRRF